MNPTEMETELQSHKSVEQQEPSEPCQPPGSVRDNEVHNTLSCLRLLPATHTFSFQ